MTDRQIWFLTGSQGLYGDDVLAQVAAQSQTVSDALAGHDGIVAEVVAKPVLTDAAAMRRMMLDATSDDRVRRRHRVDAHLLPGQDVDRRRSTRCASRCCTCTPRPTATCPGRPSTWTS